MRRALRGNRYIDPIWRVVLRRPTRGMRKRYTAEQREKLVAEVRATGARASEVAKRMGVTPSTAYLWMKAVAPAASAPVFARVVPAQSTAPVPARRIVLEVGGAKLHVESDFDPALLRQVVAALSAASLPVRACRSTSRSSP
jgi:transposase-like protein